MLNILISFLIPAFLVFFFRFLNAKYKSPIFGVYQIRNKYYWLKFLFMYIFLKLRQLKYHTVRILQVEFEHSADGTEHVHKQDFDLEQKYYFDDYPKGIDAVYFNGMSQKGDVVICNVARRTERVCDSFLFVKVKGEELLLSPSLPDTHKIQNEEDCGEYKVQGLSIQSFIPMRAWRVLYNGEMKLRNEPGKKVKVDLDLTWSSVWPHFNYDTQMSPWSMASDLAREPWSRDYFKLLEMMHQTHYEQMGFFKGTVFIDGKEHTINMPCVRDHSFGNFRDWRTFHRYVYHFIFLENGDCMAIGNVSQPSILSHLTIGYFCRRSDQSVHPVEGCDFQLYQHGEQQILPKDYAFTFQADGTKRTVRVKVNDEESFYIGKDRVSKFYERWSSAEVDGIKGWACVEWQYNNQQAK